MGIMSGLARFVGRGVSEQKSIRLTDPAAVPLFGIAPSASGITVTAASAMRVPYHLCQDSYRPKCTHLGRETGCWNIKGHP